MWTPTALASEAHAAAGPVWRVVEHQYTAATRKLVSTAAEQALLEDLLEESKPPYPPGTAQLHYLLKTPFRYFSPPPRGSRFRRAGTTEGVFYGAEFIGTAMAEMAYYRLRFFMDAPGVSLPKQEQKLTAFSVGYRTDYEIDLRQAPLNRDQALWTDPADYSATQALAEQARAAGIESIRYASVRDPEHRANIALLTFTVFTALQPAQQQTWYMHFSEAEVIALRAGSRGREEKFLFQAAQLVA